MRSIRVVVWPVISALLLVFLYHHGYRTRFEAEKAVCRTRNGKQEIRIVGIGPPPPVNDDRCYPYHSFRPAPPARSMATDASNAPTYSSASTRVVRPPIRSTDGSPAERAA
ncbi:hypothetical protein SAMN05421858_2305 [Haladaptatus litoreus]|uniref:Uncharacterized protein n=1 Tax=Haladaptatus litoreus TaxID=553468 RepID=A0A1N7B2G3_9EURY|nr:hypothetical protein SAMN05421858_2305 [Haladaptatus litoreus]